MVNIQDIRNKVAPSKTTRKISQITKIARHHSATPSGDYFAFWKNRWKGLGWTKGGYHEIILPDGTVQLCYDPMFPTNGIANHNINTYHICLVGNGAFTSAQERTFEQRCLLAMQNFGLGVDDVLGHNEFKGTATSCPGINMDSVRKRLKSLTEPKKEVAGVVNEPTLNVEQEKLLNEAKRLRLTDGKEPFGEVNRMYLFSVIVGLAQQVEELKKKIQ